MLAMNIQRDETITANRYFDAMKNSENNNANAARSRVASLSSFFSTSAIEGESRSIFGFRKFAKACLLGSGKTSKRNSSKILAERCGPHLSCRQDNSVFNDTEGLSQAIAGEKLCFAKYQRQLEKNGVDTTPKIRRGNLVSQLFDYQLDSCGVPQKVPDLCKEEIIAGIKDSVTYTTSSDEDDFCGEKFERRSIVLVNVPRSTGLSSILSQVCGGPLETILLHRSAIDNTLIRVELDFLTSNGAISFMKYGRTNLFKVNGLHLVPQWKRISETQRPALSDEFLDEIPEVCRCLIMKKYASGGKRYKHGEHSKDPTIDNLDIKEIKRDFEAFGQIQDISPIVSRKLCISVSFYCVHDAIQAMDDYENPSSQLNRKYFKTWAVWYGKDITDRPCIEI